MLAGVIDTMIDHVSADWSCAETLRKLVPPIESALQAYKDRAVADGHSFEHVIMLQAAAQGWCANFKSLSSLYTIKLPVHHKAT